MTQKLNQTPSFPSLMSTMPSGLISWANQLVAAITREMNYANARSNSLLAADGTEEATGPLLLASYTVTTLPSAATFKTGIIYVSNGTANKRLAVSDGTNWRFPDGNVVS